MKYKNKIKRLQGRIKDFESSGISSKSGYKKPGSFK